jgi:hypothetical protein
MSEDVNFWSRLGFQPTLIFELTDGRIGYAFDKREQTINNVNYTVFIAATIFFHDHAQAFTTYGVPSSMIKQIAPFNPKKTTMLSDFLSAIRAALFSEEKEEGK